MLLSRRLTPLLFCAILPAVSLTAATCDSLLRLKLPQTKITAATTIAAGAFTAPGAPPDDPALPLYRKLPAFCRVEAVSHPSPDSHIEFEVWLPSAGWNTRYAGVGNGGFAGSIAYPSLAAALAAGFATSSTDTGHRADTTDAAWAIGHPEKMIDFGYRAIHETALQTKAVVRAFYGTPAQRSYFSSCSNGGRQGLMEAQRYPADYDGIVAGAPANNFTRIADAFLWNLQAMEADPATYIPAAKLPAIEAAVLATCDASDGLKDGIIDDPRHCHFDPAVLLCKGAESSACLTQPQVGALSKIYTGPRDSRGNQIYPGFMPGGETGRQGWAAWITGSAPTKSTQYAFATSGYGSTIFDNPHWDYRTFNFDRDVDVAERKLGHILNATDADLTAFSKRGGRLVLFHGWSDPALPPLNTIDYYDSVVSKMGSKETAGFLRLYMVPGMQHCGGGPGPDNFAPYAGAETDPQRSMFASVEQWVEKGDAPNTIVATKSSNGNVVRSRPLCPYPQTAHYNGSGNPDAASSFTCR